MKSEQVIEKMKTGCKLFQYTGVVVKRGSQTYKFEDGIPVHHLIGKNLLAKKLVEKGEAVKTLGGWRTELNLKNK